MIVQAVLLHRKGISSFDPISDGYLIFNKGPEDAAYYTWRKARESLPQRVALAGVFLGDRYNNFIFEGTQDFSRLDYLHAIFPRLREGYVRSEFTGLFGAPANVPALIDKLTAINKLYFGHKDDDNAVPAYHNAEEFSWTVDPEKGITELRGPKSGLQAELHRNFYDIVRAVHPDRLHVDPRLMDPRVLVHARKESAKTS